MDYRVFAGTGEVVATYVQSKPTAVPAVNFVDGRQMYLSVQNAHYVTRHQICGKNVPWYMTNTSEPHADDMLVQAANPVSFDWMVKECGYRMFRP